MNELVTPQNRKFIYTVWWLMAVLPGQPIECPPQFAHAQHRRHRQDFYSVVPSQPAAVPAFHAAEEIPVYLAGVLPRTWRLH